MVAESANMNITAILKLTTKSLLIMPTDVTIYRPDGTQVHYTTSPDAVDTEIRLVNQITADDNQVKVLFKDTDGTKRLLCYGMMPYEIESWTIG